MQAADPLLRTDQRLSHYLASAAGGAFSRPRRASGTARFTGERPYSDKPPLRRRRRLHRPIWRFACGVRGRATQKIRNLDKPGRRVRASHCQSTAVEGSCSGENLWKVESWIATLGSSEREGVPRPTARQMQGGKPRDRLRNSPPDEHSEEWAANWDGTVSAT